MSESGQPPHSGHPRRTKEWIDQLTDDDRIRVRLTTQGGQVVYVMVQLECKVRGTWWACYRFDMHEGPHVHTKPWDPEQDRRLPMIVPDLARALDATVNTIRDNWRDFRAKLEASKRESDT